MKCQQSQLSWRGTFLEVKEDDVESEKSPKASSDPGSECSTGALHFSKEKQSVESFSQRINHVWSSSKFRKPSGSSASTDGAVVMSEAMSDRMLDCDTALCDVQSISSRFSDDPKSSPKAIHCAGPLLMPTDVLGESFANSSSTNGPGKSYRLSSALCVVDSIPEQVREILQQSAHILADDVHGDVAGVKQMIRDNETNEAVAEEAIERLEVIPELIRKSFGVSLAKMKVSVQQRVDGVINRIDRSDLASEQIVTQLSSIPEEILQMAEEAVGEAVQESQAQASQQLAFALEAAPRTVAKNHVALQQAKHQIIRLIPHLPVTPQEARIAATDTIEHAVALVHAEMAGATASTNRSVADALLRAKQGATVKSLGGEEPWSSQLARPEPPMPPLPTALVGSMVAPSTSPVPNPGSIGHPEYCPRPCLFYSSGKCAHGTQCGFCHLPHTKRPTHLDKRHREMLRLMPFGECAAIVVPIMRGKVIAMGLGPDMLSLLDGLASSAPPTGPGAVLKDTRALERALRCLPFRTLTTILHRAVPNRMPERAIVDEIMHHIRRASETDDYPSIFQ